MVGLGLLIGIVFPAGIVLLGVPSRDVESLRFRLLCVSAGVLVCGANWWLARAVVGRRFRLLSDRLRHVSDQVRDATVTGDWPGSTAEVWAIPVDSEDELGETAASFNRLLAALDREERFRSLVEESSDVISIVSAGGEIVFQSPSVERVLGWTPAALVGERFQDLFVAE